MLNCKKCSSTRISLSSTRIFELFKAIHEPIMEKRIAAVKKPLTESDLYDLDIEIHRRIEKVLNIKGG